MTSVPDKIRSNIISHNIDLHRYEAGLQRRIRAMIDRLARDLAREVAGAGLDVGRTEWRTARLKALLKAANEAIGTAYGEISDLSAGELRELMGITGSAITTAVNDALGVELLTSPRWTADLVAKLADDTLIQGAPLAEWWARQSDDLAQAFADQMRQGMLRGETVAQLRNRVLGLDVPGVNAVGRVDLRRVDAALRPPIWTARRNAETLVRTAVISTANAAHLAAYEGNDDIIEGVEWSSALDSRTCLRCGALDGKSWDLHATHPTPSLHPRCRCALLPKTKSWETLAREAHGNSTVAKRLDEMMPGDRASMGGPVSEKFKYEDWFDQQPRARQLEILGPGRLKLYEQGNLGFTDMLNQHGNPLTLDELRRK